jgi:predicted RNA-binding protein with PUA-like domain
VAAFIFKTEPSTYSWHDLVREKSAVWDGISNALALKHLRTVRTGDSIVVYHTGDEKAAVGLATAASEPYADPKLGDPKRVVIDIKPERAFARPVPLSEFRTDARLQTTELVRMPRLSVVPITGPQLERIAALGAKAPKKNGLDKKTQTSGVRQHDRLH